MAKKSKRSKSISEADFLAARAVRWDWEQRVKAATDHEPYDQAQLHELLAEGRRLFGAENLPNEPKEWWLLHHRLEPGTLSKSPRESVLGSDSEMYGLQFEYDVQPALNHEATDEFIAQREIAFDLGGEDEAKLVTKPDRPIACRWLNRKELGVASDWSIGQMSLPRLDPLTGRAKVVDWEALVAWRSDLEVAARQLTPKQRLVADLLQRDNDWEQIKRQLGWSWPDLIDTIRSMNDTLRQWAGADV